MSQKHIKWQILAILVEISFHSLLDSNIVWSSTYQHKKLWSTLKAEPGSEIVGPKKRLETQ